MRTLPGLFCVLVAGGLAAQSPVLPTRSVTDLKTFYQENCVRCHGADGSAKGPDGKKLSGFDFTDSAKAAKDTDPEMAKTIRKGIFFGITMPAFKDRLTEEEAALLVREVLRKAEKGRPIAPDPAPTR